MTKDLYDYVNDNMIMVIMDEYKYVQVRAMQKSEVKVFCFGCYFNALYFFLSLQTTIQKHNINIIVYFFDLFLLC